MQRIFSYFLWIVALSFFCTSVQAQTNKWRDIHTVKKKETLYSICRDYGISMEDLMNANPEMKQEGYQLKKGNTVFIPFTTATVITKNTTVEKSKPVAKDDVTQRAIRLGVMLPLHNLNGDGRRMVEYYRGVLMACDSLKKEGISVDVHAWNVPEDGDINAVLSDPAAARCDLLIGPLYSKFVPELSKFVERHQIYLLIPYSITAPEVYTNKYIYKVYQEPNDLNETNARRFCEWFKDAHPVIVDCGDASSTKGAFTSLLRRQLDLRGVSYSLTSLQSTDEQFRKAFDPSRQNVVVLNSARSPELNSAFGKLSAVSLSNPSLQISMFGYTEWLMYVNHQLENFYRYDVHVPSHFYTNQSSASTERLQQKFRWNFHQDMQSALPRFALTGFDHAVFFLRGLHQYGNAFDGAAGRMSYTAVQTPLKFERMGNGGMQNRAFMFIHYLPEQRIETINY